MSAEEYIHGLFVAALEADGAVLPARPDVPGVSLDAALTLALALEVADERGVVLGDPSLAVARHVRWPTSPAPWAVLAREWLSGPFSELTRARHASALADGLLVHWRPA